MRLFKHKKYTPNLRVVVSMTEYSPVPISAHQTGALLEQLREGGYYKFRRSNLSFLLLGLNILKKAIRERLQYDGYERFKNSSLPLLLLGLNLLGALAHGIGIILVRTQARIYMELPIWHYVMNNTNTTESPVWVREAEITYINPSTVITLFFSLSFGFQHGVWNVSKIA